MVLRLPEAAWPGLGGELLGALVAAGAFAAFMSTASGLLVSLAGTVSFDLWRGGAGAVSERRRRFRVAALGAIVPPIALALLAREPRHLPARGLGVRARGEHVLPAAAARDLVGGPDRARRGGGPGGRLPGVERADLPRPGVEAGSTTVDELLSQPAVISVPLAFATMVLVSLVGRGRAPATADAQLLALHAPEGLGLER